MRLTDGDPDVLTTLLIDEVWSKLSPAEKVRVIETLIERVDFDGAAGKVAIEFRPTGIKSLEVAK